MLAFPDEWGYRKQHRATWIAVHASKIKVEWVRCFSVSYDDMRVRTPHGNSLAACRILVVGCGSLGSTVGVALAQEGVGYLDLVDADFYDLETQCVTKWGYITLATAKYMHYLIGLGN